jgi:general nucleoside transport system ATP-binding protein
MKIELQHVHKRFGAVHANNDINLTFQAGRIIGILGENGAGKSTLMKILSGFQPMDSGQILIDGRAVDYRGPQAAIQNGIGMLQQDPLDVAAFTVLENFMYGSPPGTFPNRRQAAKTLRETSQRFGFELDPELMINNLSIGQRQQMEIVRLLALGVHTLILDEPTTGISAEQKDVLFGALRELAKRDQMTILLVSHKLEDVIALCDEVAVLRAGRLVGTQPMPITAQQIVTMMFGQELAPETRDSPDVSAAGEVLRLENLHLRQGRVHIPRLNLLLRAGEVIGLAGLDGSGQELLLRAAVGLLSPLGGKIILDGVDMTFRHYRQYLARGVAFGAAGRLEEGLIGGLTLTEHMAVIAERAPLINWNRAQERCARQMKLYDVRGKPESEIQTLSGGNQQRMLMALMPEQPVLMALEQPTRGLDVDSARWIWKQLFRRRDAGAAILFSSPDLDELVTYSHRILVFNAGRVFEITDAGQTTIDELGHLIGGHFEEAHKARGTASAG